MVENVAGIDSHFHRPGFCQSESLCKVGVKSPRSRQIHDALSKRAPSARLRVLKHDLIDLGILDRIQRAGSGEVLKGRHRGALRVLNARVFGGDEVVGAIPGWDRRTERLFCAK